MACLRAFAALLLAFARCAASRRRHRQATYLLRPDRVWTGDGDAAHAGWAVLVRDGAIAAVGDATRLEIAPPMRGASICPARR